MLEYLRDLISNNLLEEMPEDCLEMHKSWLWREYPHLVLTTLQDFATSSLNIVQQRLRIRDSPTSTSAVNL